MAFRLAQHDLPQHLIIIPTTITITPRQTLIHSQNQIRQNTTPKLLNIRPINTLNLPQRDIHNILIVKEEILRNLARPWVRAIERTNKAGGLAVIVELVMDGSDGEDGSLEWA